MSYRPPRDRLRTARMVTLPVENVEGDGKLGEIVPVYDYRLGNGILSLAAYGEAAMPPSRRTHMLAEVMCDEATRLKEEKKVFPKKWLDMGAGRGPHALLAAQLGAEEVWAVDQEPSAVSMLYFNALINHALLNIRQGDGFDAVPVDMRFDRIVTNPAALPTAVAKNPEKIAPWSAGGADGRAMLRMLTRDAPRYLTEQGELWMTVGSMADIAKTLHELITAGLDVSIARHELVPLTERITASEERRNNFEKTLHPAPVFVRNAAGIWCEAVYVLKARRSAKVLTPMQRSAQINDSVDAHTLTRLLQMITRDALQEHIS